MRPMRLLLLPAPAPCSPGCATTPPEEDPVVQKLTELDSRLLRIERVLANQSLLDLSQRIEAAQNETRTLRGQLDELQHNVDRTQEQQRELYGDVDRRLAGARRLGRRGGGCRGAGRTAERVCPCRRATIAPTIRPRSIC